MHNAHDILPFVLPQLNIGPPHSPILLAAPLREGAPYPNVHPKALCCWGEVSIRLHTPAGHEDLTCWRVMSETLKDPSPLSPPNASVRSPTPSAIVGAGTLGGRIAT